ncbi:NrdH-redoxin [Candidatus Uhrbacteria bacterium RIFCSPHIGHO2_01_FULL_63_20]|uniref:NrdH-redoxin n=1 Tax=Candidatus Uhrbacteria bacterium RIFCSPHIGHO2_01_FULL_63_20 TaxID=1802385 RepID=A0A1F7TLF5_9BACT|nr:MAG: NrdH-redoxin [Candidatus Uhrbacteria bacterium RIFCSPHIGHO2_01_FULL_63_20]
MKVTVYSTPTCPYCKLAKAFLDEKRIPYTDVDVTQDKKLVEEMINKSGQMGVPVIDVDGTIIVGFDRKKLEKTLGRA